MKLYLNQDGQAQGPFAIEEIKAKIYSGELSRTVFACAEGQTEWQPLELFLNNNPVAAPPVISAPTLTKAQLIDAKEKTALVWLYLASAPVWIFILAIVVLSYGTFLVYGLIYWAFVKFGQAWFAAYLKTNAVRVSETQLPEIHRVAREGALRLGMECPDIYVMQHNVWNAFATKLFKRRVIVLFSGAVDSILLKGDHQQLAFVVGHELGHHWAGHLDFKQRIAALGGWLFWVNFWHSRRRELTCDRIGLYCSGSLRASQIAMANLTVGAQLAAKVDPATAIGQWREHEKEFFVRYRTLYSTYPHLLARLDHLTQAGQEFGLKH